MGAFYDVGVFVLVLSWAVWIAAALLFHLLLPWRARLPFALSEMLTYGKLKNFGAGRASATPAKTPSPHKYFTHFYVWGSVWNTLLLIAFTYKTVSTLSLFDNHNSTPPQSTAEKHLLRQTEIDVFLTLSLLLCQTVRRLSECVCVMRHSQRKMHVVHYVLGFYFYTVVGPTAMLHLNQDSHEPTNYPFSMNWRYAVALVVFVWASYHQYTCHQILADLRRSNSTNNFSSRRNNVADTHPPKPSQTLRVGIPHGDWFALVSCPHYLAEILIYCSLLVVQAGSLTMLLPCSFVAFVLGLSARQMHSWYLDKFDDYPKNRKRIIPYIF